MNLNRPAALACAIRAARAAGALMLRNRRADKIINEQSRHDIKLELDVRCQKLIQKTLFAAFPNSLVFGEEGAAGPDGAPWRWVVDPIDGTVNFSYGVPHACVSIALQQRVPSPAQWVTLLGVVLDPFCDELWSAIRGGPARLNGRPIHVSRRRALADSMVSIGFAKNDASLLENLPVFIALVRRVRKIRMMGAAALGLAYVASGRFDAYIESGISLWDIAAGGLIVQCAGGEFWHRPLDIPNQYRMVASNGLLRGKLERVARAAKINNQGSQLASP
ncbi:MAG: inositol monophosphatase family protein [Verrucomicrobiota bacterium]|jgi:myo-inositol-1(or 4)-monophosphatase